jgi:excinuclease ABC subunit A
MTTTLWWCPQGEQRGALFDRAHAKHDVIKTADWVIDLGPEGGVKGGEIVAVGTPEAVVKEKRSFTGRYLAPLLGKRVREVEAAE